MANLAIFLKLNLDKPPCTVYTVQFTYVTDLQIAVWYSYFLRSAQPFLFLFQCYVLLFSWQKKKICNLGSYVIRIRRGLL